MQRRSLLLVISTVLAIVGVAGVYLYARSPRTEAAATATAAAPAIRTAPAATTPSTAQNTTPPPATGGLRIPAGLMAVSVSVSPIASVAGYVQPASQIAIFDTYPTLDKHGTPSAVKDVQRATDDWATKLVVARAQVLAVMPKSAASADQSGQQGGVMVTVAVTQADAQRLIHVTQTGRLYFTLLTGSSHIAPDPGVDNQGALGNLFASTAGRG